MISFIENIFIITAAFFIGRLMSSWFTHTRKISKTKIAPCTFPGPQYKYWEKKLQSSDRDLEEDCICLKYLLETSYAGYEPAIKKGIDFDALIADSASKNSEDFAWKLAEKLAYIGDGHFSIQADNFYRPTKHEYIYFSNIYVKKTTYAITVYRSDVPDIRAGARYCGKPEYLFCYPAAGKEIYRIGSVSKERIKTLAIIINKKQYEVPVATEYSIKNTSLRLKKLETEKSVYMSCSTFQSKKTNLQERRKETALLKKFAGCSTVSVKNKNIILDLRGNTGGSIDLSRKLITRLLFQPTKRLSGFIGYLCYLHNSYTANGSYTAIETFLTLQGLSAWTKQNNPGNIIWRILLNLKMKYMQKYPHKILRKTGDCNKKKAERLRKQARFKGNLYILTNRDTASAAELLIVQAYHLIPEGKIFILGENTKGCILYDTINTYKLPHSGISISLCADCNENLLRATPFHGEGKGFYPDYWSTNTNILNTLITVTGDKDLQNVIPNIENGLQ